MNTIDNITPNEMRMRLFDVTLMNRLNFLPKNLLVAIGNKHMDTI